MYCMLSFANDCNIACYDGSAYIGVGLSALLVSADMAMREPRHVERAIRSGSTLFLLWIQDKII